MNSESRKSLNEMMNFMKRMEMHTTLNESIFEDGGNAILKPYVNINIRQDKSLRKKFLFVSIKPLFNEDIKKIFSTYPYSTDSSIQRSENGIIFYTTILEIKNKPEENKTDNPQQQKSGGLVGLLNKQKQNVSEGNLLSKLKQKAAQSSNDTTSNDNTVKQVDNIYSWLKNYYMGIVNIISANPNYDKNSIDKLKDFDEIYANFSNKLHSVDNEEDKIYPEKTSEEIKKEITSAIINGNWQTVLQQHISPVSLEALIFGNQLSLRNRHAIQKRANDLGIQNGAQNYPSLVLGPSSWKRFFNRKIVDNPQANYPIVANLAGKGKKQGMGTKGHVDSFKNLSNGFETIYGYDVTDTEPIDPNDTNDYFALPGVKNNLTGELNQAAIDYKEAKKRELEQNMTDTQKKQLAEIQTEDGKAKVFNDALMSYAERNGIKANFVQLTNNGNNVYEYAKNIYILMSYFIAQKGYANDSIAKPMSIVSAYAIGCYTMGADEILKNGNYQFNLKNEWDNSVDNILSLIRNTINAINKYLNIKYSSKFSETSVEEDDEDSQQMVSEAMNIEFLLKRIINE